MTRRLEDILLRTIIPAAGKIKPAQIIRGEDDHPRKIAPLPITPGTMDSFFPHYHNMPEFCWCLAGKCTMQVGANHYLVQRGDLCLMGRNTHHFESFHKAQENYEIVWFIFPTMAECLMALCYYKNRKYQQRQSLHLAIAPEVVRHIDRVCEKELPAARSARDIRLLFRLFAQHLRDPQGVKKEYIFTDQGKGNFQLKRILQAQEYIQEHYAEKLSLEKAARVAGLNPEYFARLFHQINRTTYVDFVTSVRLQQAQQFMNETLLTLSEISYRVGFNDFYYFSKVFKKYYGLSPRRFRDKYVPTDAALIRREKKLRKEMTDDRVVY